MRNRSGIRKHCFQLTAALFAAGALLARAAEPGGMAMPAQQAQSPAGPFAQAALPYPAGALAPYIGQETVDYHYGKHYKAYVGALNKLVAGKPEAALSLEALIMSAPPGPLFNNAAQAWNHAFYFSGLSPSGGGEPAGALAEAIKKDFGSFAEFREAFVQAATGLFGSGWVWLVLDGNTLKVLQTSNSDLPMKHGQQALLVLDVWEHAYYLDYRNLRPKYIDAALDHLVNWNFAADNYAAALRKTASARP